MSKKIDQIKVALANYIASEGCSCCQDISGHTEALKELGELLGVEKYSDDSGYDFSKHQTIYKKPNE